MADAARSDGNDGPLVPPELLDRVWEREAEMEAALVARLQEIYQLPVGARSGLVASAQVIVPDVLAYTIRALEVGEGWSEPIPESYADLARWAARSGMSLEDVLRGWHAGSSVFQEYMAEEFKRFPDLKLFRFSAEVQTRIAGGLVGGLTAAYESELAKVEASDARLAQCVERLLGGESVDASDLDYSLDAWHVGAVVSGPDGRRGMELLAEQLGCKLLSISRPAEVHWAWWGAPRRIDYERLEAAISDLSGSVCAAVGEARWGEAGFRRSHREAQVAAAVVVHHPSRLVRGLDVMLPGLFLEEPEFGELFLHAYLEPLKAERNWPALRETLKAYFGADGNLASAAAAVGIDRHTVRRRLVRAERILGTPVERRRAELEVALRIEDLTASEPLEDPSHGTASSRS